MVLYNKCVHEKGIPVLWPLVRETVVDGWIYDIPSLPVDVFDSYVDGHGVLAELIVS